MQKARRARKAWKACWPGWPLRSPTSPYPPLSPFPHPQPGADPSLHRLDGPAPSPRSPRPLLDIDFGSDGPDGPDGPNGPDGVLLLGYSPVRGSRGPRSSPSKRWASLRPDVRIELHPLTLKRARLDPALAVAARPPLPVLALAEPPVSTFWAFQR